MMAEKPILFNTEMVKAIMEGRKTQTRRVIRFPDGTTGRLPECGARDYIYYPGGIKYPPYQAEDVLWVRETWCRIGNPKAGRPMHYCYRADMEEPSKDDMGFMALWKPSIHMPKDAARLFLRVKDVRMERLQYMSEEDAISEGYSGICPGAHTVYFSDGYAEPCHVGGEECHYGYWYCNHSIPEAFGRDIWDGTIKPADLPRYGWEANPWVWAYEFERCEKPKGWNHG